MLFINLFNTGNSSVSIPYKNKLEEKDFEEKLIWIKQCRLHYLFGTKRHVHELFQEKEIEFHLFVTRREDVYSAKTLQRSSSGNLVSRQVASGRLQWESTFKVSFHQLKWLYCAPSESGLLEKVDLFVPISTNSMGPMVLKMSIAIEFTDFVPLQAANCHFLREKGVFWPPSGYSDGTPIPASWLAMMTPTRTANDFNLKKIASTPHFYDSPADKNSSVAPSPVPTGALKGGRVSIGLRSADTAAASATDRNLQRNMSSGSMLAEPLNGQSVDLEEAAIDVAKFDRISSLIPFVGRVFDRQRVVDNGGGVRTITALHAILDALSACLQDPSLLAGENSPEANLSPLDKANVDAIESLQAAVPEMLSDDRGPICMTWVVFLEKVASYVGVILKKEARDQLVRDVQSKLSLGGPPDGGNGSADGRGTVI